jgi:hypothetical protein
MATPKKRLKDRLIISDGPEEYNSASEECDNEIVDETALSSPAQSDKNDWEADSGSQSQTGSGNGSEDTESESSSPPPPRERRSLGGGGEKGL